MGNRTETQCVIRAGPAIVSSANTCGHADIKIRNFALVCNHCLFAGIAGGYRLGIPRAAPGFIQDLFIPHLDDGYDLWPLWYYLRSLL